MKTLKKLLIEHKACEELFNFTQNLTLEQFLNTCERGDWILWLFAKMNPNSKKELVLAAGHCANTVRHLMTDKRSTKAVDMAIAFGEGKASEEELGIAYCDAAAAAARYADDDDADNAAAYAANAYAAHEAARKENIKQTADICRKYLPIEIWY